MEYMDLPIDLLLIIYSFVGNNFIVNKNIHNALIEYRNFFFNSPVRIYYRLAQWKYVGEPNRTIINRLTNKLRPSLKVHHKTYVDVSNVPIGFVKDNGNIIPSSEIEEKVVPHMQIIERRERVYVYSKISTWNIYQCWTKTIKKAKNYSNLWISRKNLNRLIIPYNINGKITKR